MSATMRARTKTGRPGGNSVATSGLNQGRGAVAIGALAAAATGTVTINDARITPSSRIDVTIMRGTTTPAAGAFGLVASVRPPTVGSVIVDVANRGSAASIATDFQLAYEVR